MLVHILSKKYRLVITGLAEWWWLGRQRCYSSMATDPSPCWSGEAAAQYSMSSDLWIMEKAMMMVDFQCHSDWVV